MEAKKILIPKYMNQLNQLIPLGANLSSESCTDKDGNNRSLHDSPSRFGVSMRL